jgi:hypothetical protein
MLTWVGTSLSLDYVIPAIKDSRFHPYLGFESRLK